MVTVVCQSAALHFLLNRSCALKLLYRYNKYCIILYMLNNDVTMTNVRSISLISYFYRFMKHYFLLIKHG